ncbi:DoxX family membrane protein [Vulgatibacter sp.]|uniref:DoxX family membrane protein n=1 Tax=Vulgatibacter sp. TaxID=1971226 RepID=UPI00356A2D83
MERKVSSTFHLLRLTYGIVPIVAGADKFVGLLTDWSGYLGPIALQLLPFSPQAFMYLVGVIEIAAGILVLVRPRIGAFVVSAWLLAIAVNLVLGGFFDIAVRDVVMAIGAFALGRLAMVHAGERAHAAAPMRPARAHG